MPVNFSVKGVPDELAARLRERAAANHRSLQGELMAILHEATSRQPAATADWRQRFRPAAAAHGGRPSTIDEVVANVLGYVCEIDDFHGFAPSFPSSSRLHDRPLT